MNRLLYILILVTLSNSTLICQVRKDSSYLDPLLGNVGVWQNTVYGTKEILFNGGYIVKDSLGRVLIDGNKSGDCSCEPIENGFWIYYYENGKIKEQGSFDCGEKIDTWITFYRNGTIKQVINFKKPYSGSFIRHFGDTLNLRRIKPMKHGQFLEYYDNGQIKTSGQFEIIHIKSTVDSLVTTNKETYEKVYEKVEGEFWLPTSVKIGTWKQYSADGKIEKVKNYKLEEDWRELDLKYWELIELFNKEKPHITIDKK